MKAIAFFDIEISDRSFRYYFGVTAETLWWALPTLPKSIDRVVRF